MAVIVDEYGEIEGIVTVQDIIEELVGEFRTSGQNSFNLPVVWSNSEEAIVDGLISIRELNKQLNLKLPLNGPKTLNGLILETLRISPKQT